MGQAADLPGPPRRGNLSGKVVVVTGGSAGVGRATALLFARHGARVALIARDEAGLQDARAEIGAAGGDARIFPADVADAAAVSAAAIACEDQLGPVDVWVNNAMATVFSPVSALTAEEIQRVTDVTYMGCVHGTLAALRQMRPRGRGVIVQVGSALAYRGIPLQSAYCAAKHAIRGFTDSLRTELEHEGSAVRVTAVHLPAINTPQFDWARTHDSALPRPVAPVYAPEAAAEAIVRAAVRPAREVWLGASTPATILGNALAPALMDRYLASRAVDGQRRDGPPGPDRADNLFQPVPGKHRTRGSFSKEVRRKPVRMPGPAARGGALAATCAAAAAAGVALGLHLAARPKNAGPR